MKAVEGSNLKRLYIHQPQKLWANYILVSLHLFVCCGNVRVSRVVTQEVDEGGIA